MKWLWNCEPVALVNAVRLICLAGMTFGLHLTPVQLGASLIALEAVLTLITRSQVTPAGTAAPMGSVSAGKAATLLVLLALMGGVWACASAPPTLSPVGVRAFQETRVVKAADVFRDFVVDANAQTPPIIDTTTARKIVTWHESALKILKASNAGWQITVSVSLDEAVKDIPAPMAAKIAPYLSLVKAALKEIS